MLLYCVRHGESAYNAEGRIQGQTDVPLSATGLRQAEALGKEFATLPVDAIFASPLRRAFDTAAPIGRALGLEVRTDDRLKELNAGVFQGLTWDELAGHYPVEAAKWKSHDVDFAIPGGESRRQLTERGVAALEAIREAGFQRVALIGHGGLLTAAIKHLLGIPPQRGAIALFNASISQCRWTDEFRLVTLNQLDHLRRFDEALTSRLGDL